MVKQDINSLENPFWFQDETLAERSEDGFVWKNSNGYIFRAGYKPPVKTDVIFLLYLLMQSQRQNWTDELRMTRYQIIKECGLNINNVWYDRLEDCLKRWEMTRIEYSGSFYDGKNYQTMHFGVIDYWSIEKETKNLRIRFSPEYLLMVKNTAFYRFLNFDQVKALRSPLATRLYEILIKTFQGRDSWEIDAVKLAEKIPMAEKYPAHIVLKIQPAINRINRSTDLKIDLQIRKKSRGETILIFEKQRSEPKANKEKPAVSPVTTVGKPSQPELPLARPELAKTKLNGWTKPIDPELQKLLKLLPSERQSQKSLQEAIYKAFNRHGFEYVAWNIKYANKHAKGNYPAYLLKAIKEDYGQALREEEEVNALAVRDRAQAQKKHLSIKQQQQNQEVKDTELAQVYIAELSEEARLELEEVALTSLPPIMRARIEKAGRKSISFQAILRGLALKKLSQEKHLVAALEPTE